MENQKKYEITKNQIIALLDYLYLKPYNEVVQGVQMLTSLPEIKEEIKKEEPKNEE